MNALGSYETSVSVGQSTRRNISEDLNLQWDVFWQFDATRRATECRDLEVGAMHVPYMHSVWLVLPKSANDVSFVARHGGGRGQCSSRERRVQIAVDHVACSNLSCLYVNHQLLCTDYYLFIKYYSPLHVSSLKCSSSGGYSCIYAAYGIITVRGGLSVNSLSEDSLHSSCVPTSHQGLS